MEVLYLTIVIFTFKTQIFHVSSFTNTCESSLATLDFVERCPNDTDSYIKAAARKNCSARQHSCTSFEYHCVLNDWKNATIEVCAPSIKIIGRVCTEFDVGLQSIFRMDGTNCGDAPPCPFSYNSTEAYKYSGCYNLETYSTVPVNPSEKGSGYSITEENQAMTTSKGVDQSADAQVGVIGGVSATIAVIILIVVLLIILKRKGKLCKKGNSEKTPSYNLVPQVPQNSQQEEVPGTGDDPADSTTSNVTGTGDDPTNPTSYSSTGAGDDQVDLTASSVTDGPLPDIDNLHGSIKPAYKTEDIRQKSFSDCHNFLKNKSKEFAAAGFFYKDPSEKTKLPPEPVIGSVFFDFLSEIAGYDYVVVCYHCGKEGTEWTENDTAEDIMNKHYQLNQECRYIEIIRNRR